MLQIAICDDNTKITSELESLINHIAAKKLITVEIDVFFDGVTLKQSVKNGMQYDLIYIDIEMKNVNGIQAARYIRKLDKTVLLIYVSGYEEYLKELFEVEPFRFLSKPVNHQIFYRYFEEAFDRITNHNIYFQFKFNKEIKKVALRNIIYFESKNRVVYIVLQSGSKERFYGKLNDIQKELDKSKWRFIRIHQSYLVNYDYITKMNFSNVYISFMEQKITLQISEDRQKQVRQQLCQIAGGKVVIT